MLSVEEALARILDGVQTLGTEMVSLENCSGRIVSMDIHARITQPPFAASAMDGYAVRFCDAGVGETLEVIGEAPAGEPFDGEVLVGQAVRIFTGGVVPTGADHIVIQEDVRRDGAHLTISEAQDNPRNIRAAGVDFKKGEVLVNVGETLHEIHGSILAAANNALVPVTRRPKVMLFSNGDELMEPGADLKPGQIINSNHYALTQMVRLWGGEPTYLGCAADTEQAIRDMFSRGWDADLIIPIGGASVGDYDFVKPAFLAEGGVIAFEKIAVRPGKPTWFGRMGGARIVGLPGNPASALVTAALFVQPLVRRLAGQQACRRGVQLASLTEALEANGKRESYLRAVSIREGGDMVVAPVSNQDSSLLRPFTRANVLIRRPVDAPALSIGDQVEIVRLR